jgi:hypothetical protein
MQLIGFERNRQEKVGVGEQRQVEYWREQSAEEMEGKRGEQRGEQRGERRAEKREK